MNNAVIARAVRDALDTARFAAASDYHLPKTSDEAIRAAVKTGVELAAVALAHALDLPPGSEARKAFLTACGASLPGFQ
jgi:hypothetical protein